MRHDSNPMLSKWETNSIYLHISLFEEWLHISTVYADILFYSLPESITRVVSL